MDWLDIKQFKDLKFEKSKSPQGIIKITINRPEVRNAFRPQTVFELQEAFDLAKEDLECGVVILTGEGSKAFCSGGDQKVRGDAGYVGQDGILKTNKLPNQLLDGLKEIIMHYHMNISQNSIQICDFGVVSTEC